MGDVKALQPVTETELADIFRKAMIQTFAGLDLSVGPSAPSFDFLTLATGQRFKVTVTEVT